MAWPRPRGKTSDHAQPLPEARTSQCGLLAVMSAAFPRHARVRKRAEYGRVFDLSRRTSDPLLSLHWLRAEHPPRLGLAVSRKVDNRAVGRNRIKRQLREHFRTLRSRLAPGDYVIVVRPPAAQAGGVQIRDAFERTLRRAGALPPLAADVTMPPTPNSPSTSAPDSNAG